MISNVEINVYLEFLLYRLYREKERQFFKIALCIDSGFRPSMILQCSFDVAWRPLAPLLFSLLAFKLNDGFLLVAMATQHIDVVSVSNVITTFSEIREQVIILCYLFRNRSYNSLSVIWSLKHLSLYSYFLIFNIVQLRYYC